MAMSTALLALRAPAAAPRAGEAPPTGEQLSSTLSAIAADTQAWWATHLDDIALAAALSVTLFLGLQLARAHVRRLARQHREPDGVVAVALAVFAKTKPWFIALVALWLAMPLANAPDRVRAVVGFLFSAVATFQVAIWLRSLIINSIRVRARSGERETLNNAMTLINVIVTVVLFAIAGIVVLGSMGIDVTALVAGLGIGGIAIGLAAKGIFEDLFSALAIIFDRPFQVGDTVSYGQTTGTVERIGLKTTRLRALTGEHVVISNQKLLDQEVRNLSDLQRRRFSMPFGVSDATRAADLARVPELAREAAERAGAVLVRCSFTGFGASSFDHEWLIDVAEGDIVAATAARHRAAVALVEIIAREGLSFSVPTQLALHAPVEGATPTPAPLTPSAAKEASQ